MNRSSNLLFSNMLHSMLGASSLLLGLSAVACGSPRDASRTPVLVAAAANQAEISRPLGEAFARSYGRKVTFSLGSSGQLEQQIRQGAPFDVFAPAGLSFCESLERDGYLRGQCRVFALGRLVAWSSSLQLGSLAELNQDRIQRVAIANPQFAPYGVAAQQALQAAGVWETIQPKLIVADNISQTFQMAETGNVDVALVALALVKNAGRPYYLIDSNLHQPIEQPAAVLLGSAHQQAAHEFVDFLFSSQAKQILTDYGYEPPSPAIPAP